MQILTFPLMALLSGAANAGKLVLGAVVSAAGVLVLWLLPTILGCGALSIAYCLSCMYTPRATQPTSASIRMFAHVSQTCGVCSQSQRKESTYSPGSRSAGTWTRSTIVKLKAGS